MSRWSRKNYLEIWKGQAMVLSEGGVKRILILIEVVLIETSQLICKSIDWFLLDGNFGI